MSDFDATYVDSLDGMVGNPASIEYLKRYAADIEKGNARRPVLLYGPSGTGKTLAAHLLAKWIGWNMVEMSASDYRDSAAIERRLHVSSGTRSLFGARNLLLLDEVDELSSRFDSGAPSSIGKLVNESKSPVMLIANNMWDQSISFLRGKVDTVEFKKLTVVDISKILKNVAIKLGVEADPKIVDALASRSVGDARSAINDFIVMIGSDEQMLDSIGLRDRKSDIFSVLDKIFGSNTYSAPLRAISNSDVDNDMLIKWIDENLPYRYSQISDIKSGYASLANATKFSNRASRKQYYTYWRYMSVMMSSGVALSKTSAVDTRRRYSFPKLILELSSTKAERTMEIAIAKKLQKDVHYSIREIRASVLPIISLMVSKALENGSEKGAVSDFLAAKFGLNEKEADYLISNHSSRRAR